MKKKSVTAILLIVLQSVLYGLGDPVSKAAFETVPLFKMLTLRYSIALAVMMLIWGRRIIEGVKRTSWRNWIVPVLCMGGAYVSNNVGLLLTQATTVAFIRSLPTIIAPVLAFIVFRRRNNKVLIPIQLAVVAGLYMLCCGRGGLGHGFGWGEFFALLSAVLLAASLVYAEKSLNEAKSADPSARDAATQPEAAVDPITLTALQTAASAAMAFIGMIFVGEQQTEPMTIKVWAIIFYLAIMCTIAGYLLQNIALKSIQSHTVAVVQCLCPVMTAVFSLFILGERMSAFGICGAAIILVSLVAAVLVDRE